MKNRIPTKPRLLPEHHHPKLLLGWARAPRAPTAPSPSPPRDGPQVAKSRLKSLIITRIPDSITEEFTTNNISPYKGKINFSSNSGLAPASPPPAAGREGRRGSRRPLPRSVEQAAGGGTARGARTGGAGLGLLPP